MNRHASLVLLAALVVGLGACTVTTSRQISATPPVEMLAATAQGDIVDLMLRMYAPAHTQLSLDRPMHDALGQGLVATLRERGYAVQEPEIGFGRQATSLPISGLSFSYRLEPVREDGLYELLVTVGNTRLSRVYALDSEGSALAPAGDWARRE